MKKSLFFVAAASALMLTACSSENDVLQSATPSQPTTVQQQAVGFDVYTPAATSVTRAGLEGTMTTSRLQRTEYEGGGFGVYAFQVQDQAAGAGYASGKVSSYLDPDGDGNEGDSYRTSPIPANFMINEKILWNATNQGWYYNPLKYWPNETDNDSQSSSATMLGGEANNHIDRLTFFAYAPYVSKGVDQPGIMRVTDKFGHINTNPAAESPESYIYADKTFEPSIQYKAALDDPNQAVDLLWGVAPAGGLSYTAVNGQTVTVKEGEPLMDMTKPDVNTNMKFLFQHALARIGVTAVAAVDQVGAGGNLDPNTKITIEKITLKGLFGETGILNLDNEKANVANWRYISDVDLSTKKSVTKVADIGLAQTTLTLKADHTSGTEEAKHQLGTIARHLQFVGTVNEPEATSAAAVAQTDRIGVTTVRQNVIMPALIDNDPGDNRNWYTMKTYGENELAYSETTPYYTNINCTTQAGVTMPASYVINSEGCFVETAASGDKAFKYPSVLDRYKKSTGWHTITAEEAAAKTYDSYPAYSVYKKISGAPTATGQYVYMSSTGYLKVTDSDISRNTYGYKTEHFEKKTYYMPKDGKPLIGDAVITDGLYFYQLTADNKAYFKGEQLYSHPDSKYTPLKEGKNPAENDYVAIGQKEKIQPYYAPGTYYKRDANYFMVVPVNNVPNICTGLTDEEKLRTVTVQIEYYITTEDGKLANKRAQTKNIITKDVVFPSIANGKSYNLNLVLGLTSVKMEAEVDDWKVVNVQGDLPQNTATE